MAWYAFSDVYVDDDVRFGSAEFRFGAAESDIAIPICIVKRIPGHDTIP